MAPKRIFTTETLILADKGVATSLVGIADAIELMNFVSGEVNCFHQLPRGMEQIRPFLRKQHPWLGDVPDLDHITNAAQLNSFMLEQIARFGSSHEVCRMPPGIYDNWDPIHAQQEMAELDAQKEREAAEAARAHNGEADVDGALKQLFGNGGSVTIADLFGDEH